MSSSGPSEGHAAAPCAVDVWTIHLAAPQHEIECAGALLSPDERARAARFHFDRHRRAFVLGRAGLRILLAQRLGVPPQSVEFQYGPKGKPALAGCASRLRFNASNSGDLAACCFTESCEIGIDIEQARPLSEVQDIAHRFFSPEEVSELMALAEPERPAAFFRCWTRKEAYIKAVGDGLSLPLDDFRVTLTANDAARIVHLGGSAEAAAGWSMHDFAPAPEYFGAVTYPDRARTFKLHPLLSAEELLSRL